MNKIEGYSIQNGEPTPDNPAEIRSLDIEDIKFIDEMIKEYNTFGDLDNPDYEDTDRIYKAIENILKKIKELEEQVKNEIKGRDILAKLNEDSIPKQKVKDVLTEIQKEYEKLDKASDDFLNNKEKTVEDYVLEKERLATMQTLAYCRDNLEELLKESK